MASRGVATSYATGVYRASEQHGLWRPRLTPATKKPGVMFLGGLGTTAATWLSSAFRPQVDLCAAAGLAALGSDQGGTATWGNDTSIAAADDMYDYLTAAGGANPAERVGIMCGSMGAAIACNWARQNLDKVACIHMTIPAVDVEDIRANNRGGHQASIETAYTNDAGWQAARPTHNPIEYAAELAGVPIRILYSTDDPICIPSLVEDFSDAVGATLVSLGAVGHNGSGQDYAASNAWLIDQLDL